MREAPRRRASTPGRAGAFAPRVDFLVAHAMAAALLAAVEVQRGVVPAPRQAVAVRFIRNATAQMVTVQARPTRVPTQRVFGPWRRPRVGRHDQQRWRDGKQANHVDGMYNARCSHGEKERCDVVSLDHTRLRHVCRFPFAHVSLAVAFKP